MSETRTEERELFNNPFYMRAWEKIVGKDRFTFVETGPAVSIIPIRRRSDGQLELVLLREERIETGQVLIKAPGGYLRGRQISEAANEILTNETGLSCDHYVEFIREMAGFTTVKLPIATWLALTSFAYPKIEPGCMVITLDNAVELVLKNQIQCQATCDALMRLWILEKSGELLVV